MDLVLPWTYKDSNRTCICVFYVGSRDLRDSHGEKQRGVSEYVLSKLRRANKSDVRNISQGVIGEI